MWQFVELRPDASMSSANIIIIPLVNSWQWKAYTSSPPAISGETTLSGTNTSSPFVSTSTTTSASVVTTSSTNTNTNTFASSTLSSSSSGRSSGSASSKGRTMPIGGNEILGREASGTAITDSVIEEDELLLVGDKVIIGVDEERLVKLQQTFGGCTKGMISRIGIEGVVTAVPSLQTPAVSVKYTEKQSYRLNPAVLVKITSFIEGDVVRVRRDVQQVTFLNKSLGWSENMDKACGKVGRVRAVDSSGHVTVRIGSQEWKFHAACLLPALGAPLDDVKPEERPDRNLLNPLMRLLGLEGDDSSGKDNSDPRVQQLFLKINVGDAGSVRRMVEANRHLLTAVHKGMTPLGYAGHCGRIHVMDTLLDLGADINGKDGKRRTALHRAIEGSEERAALHLIDKGADVKASSRKNQTPLHFAAIRGMTTVIARLIALGADVNATGGAIVDHGDGRRQLTPLHLACKRGQFRAAKCLIEMGANVNATDIYGSTPLHLAMGKVPEDKRVSESVDKEMTEDECIRMARLLIDSGPLWMFWTTAARLPWTTQKPQGDAVLLFGNTDIALALNPVSDPSPMTTTLTAVDSEDSGAADLTSPTPGSGACSKQHDAALMQDLLKGVSLQCPSCDRMSDVTLQPCGHKSVCQKCVTTFTSCPVCDVHIDEKEVDNTDDDISEEGNKQ
ncbi:hypothetical protein C0Q70_02461 [Pomacea canaliculata]|uniref:RING-type E3 ubiquitin transferase n=1 Tax=Pomacea canaliculata TaxID=400727 RepID=A0A2T7PQ05_POMCA|nr:hypothetical protein C0Q70_02461 [Pomacea canaliculata]